MKLHRIKFPQTEALDLAQDEVSFALQTDAGDERIRFHDYDLIYRHPGLYEQLFYERLKCQSPSRVAAILRSAVEQAGEVPTTLRVLDLGAGNGIMGEELRRLGVARVIVADGGWVAFNIRDTFLDQSESTEFSQTVRKLVFTDYLEIHNLERYRHRLSIDGEPLFYYAIAGRKLTNAPKHMFDGSDEVS